MILRKNIKCFICLKINLRLYQCLKQITLQSEERGIQTKKAGHISRQLVYYMRLHIL